MSTQLTFTSFRKLCAHLICLTFFNVRLYYEGVKINFLLLIFIHAFLLVKPALASPRDEIISLTLDQVESVYAKGVALPTEYLVPDETNSADYFRENQNSPAHLTESQGSYAGAGDSFLNGTFSISAGFNGSHMRYKELQGVDILDENRGNSGGFYLGLAFRSNNYIAEIMAKPYIEAYWRESSATIKYIGRASNGITTRDFSFYQNSKIRNSGLKIGGYTKFTDNGEISGYFDLGQRSWYRGKNAIVDNVIVYSEKYYWTYLGLGIGANFLFLPQFSSGIDAEWMFTPGSPKMRANLYEGGTFGLKNVNGFEIKMPLKYYILKNLSLDLTPYFTYWKIGKSDPVKINGAYYYEPDSKTFIQGVFAGFTYIL